MFEGIQRNLGEALKKLRGRGRITEANIRESMGEIRKALLEADVNFTVANEFIQRVTEQAVGQQVLRTLDPSEQIVQIIAVACEPPEHSGRPISHWTVRELADEVQKRGIVATVSPRSVGRFLKRGRVAAAPEPLLAQCQPSRP